MIAVATLAAAWDRANDPSQFAFLISGEFSYKLSELKESVKLKDQPWSDTYWPNYRSGIAQRWFAKDPQDYNYTLYTVDELRNLTTDEKKALSPAEKYSIYIGRYDYPLVRSEWMRTSKEDPRWEGICHGWAPAAAHYKEPEPIDVVNDDGILVPFGSSDIKALLSYYVGQYDRGEPTAFVGRRCNSNLGPYSDRSLRANPECADLDADTFHVS